jgi:hypothetical protein
MVSVVNGYVCFSSCQASAARAGRDPHAPPGTPPGQHDSKDKANGLAGQPPSILDPGHSNDGVNDPNAVDPSGAAGAGNGDYRASQIINRLI